MFDSDVCELHKDHDMSSQNLCDVHVLMDNVVLRNALFHIEDDGVLRQGRRNRR